MGVEPPAAGSCLHREARRARLTRSSTPGGARRENEGLANLEASRRRPARLASARHPGHLAGCCRSPGGDKIGRRAARHPSPRPAGARRGGSPSTTPYYRLELTGRFRGAECSSTRPASPDGDAVMAAATARGAPRLPERGLGASRAKGCVIALNAMAPGSPGSAATSRDRRGRRAAPGPAPRRADTIEAVSFVAAPR